MVSEITHVFPDEITFEVEHDDIYISPYIHLVAPESDLENLRHADEFVAPQQIQVIYSYPFSKKFTFTHDSGDSKGFTLAKLASTIAEQYQKMYQEEENYIAPEPDNPEHLISITGMLNRRTTHGPYGIWGHVLSDLVLHTIVRKPGTNIYWLEIDS